MGEVYKSFAQINLARGEDNGGAVAESAFNRELLFKAWHGLRQKKKKERKTTLKVDQLFSIGLLLSFLAATPLCPPIILLTFRSCVGLRKHLPRNAYSIQISVVSVYRR